jgi:ribosomal protein L37E
MEPTRDTHATLVDLLDRVLDKGLVLNADLIIHVAGIPLLGVNLKACLAGMETMLKYGIWRDWDEAQRAVATEEQRRKKGVPLATDEEVILKMFASQWYSKGIYHNWRPGHLHITDRRVLLFRKEPAEVLFQCFYEEIKGMATELKNNIAGKETDYLYLWLSSGEVAQLHPSDAQAVKDAIEERMKVLGLELEETMPLLTLDETARQFLSSGEQLLHSGKMSHLVAEPRPGGITTDVWKPGHLYITNQRLIWWYDFDGKIAFEMLLDRITGVEVKRKDLGGMLRNKPVLDLIYRNGTGDGVASFSDAVEELNQWQKMIGEVATGHHQIDGGDDTEGCPRCGTRDSINKLLKEGCSICGWVSPRLRREEVKV